jgi:mono/diheme cytochrome c family protein
VRTLLDVPRVLVTLAFALVALTLVGCSGGDEPTAAEPTAAEPTASTPGAAVFADAGCGGCHTLSAAGSTGTVGPNLDQVSLDRERVIEQITRGGGAMPAFRGRLANDEIETVADFLVTSTAGNSAQGDAFKPDDTTLSDCKSENSGCYLQAFGNLAYRSGPKKALDEFAEAIRTNPVVERGCHPIAHTIGAGALLHYRGDVGLAFAEGTATCGSGFYHGLLEWKLADVSEDDVAPVAREVCNNSRIRTSNFVYYQCVHGLGHGLMLYTRYDLPDALGLCHRLVTDFDRISCTGGVFMENQQSSYGQRSKYLKDDNLLYPCDSDLVVGTDKLYCYLLVTSYILPRVGGDWAKVADWCRKSDADYIRICFQSMGRDASGTARQEPSGILESCRQARPDGEGECLFGAARDILNNDSSDLRGRELCESVPAGHRSYCFYGLGSILGSVYGSAGERRDACTRFAASAADQADCMRGAESVTR